MSTGVYKIMRIAVQILAITIAVLTIAEAQEFEFSAEAAIDTTQGRIGDIFELRIDITADSNLSLIPPPTNKAFGDFQVLSSMEPVIENQGQDRKYSFIYQVAAYRTGELTVPEIIIKAVDIKGKEYTTSTNELPITIVSVLPTTAADSLQIKDIKPIMEFPLPFYYYLLIAGVILVVVGLVYFYFWNRKRKTGLLAGAAKPSEPPWITAMKMLEELSNQRYLEKGEFKWFHYKLSEIGKFYVDRRFKFPAIERTTTEIKYDYERLKPVDFNNIFIEYLEYADLVKFAKHPSSISEGGKWFGFIETLIRKSKPGAVISQSTLITEKVEK